MFVWSVSCLAVLVAVESTQVWSVDKDFHTIQTDEKLQESAQAILKKISSFKVPVHPRVRLYYRLLKERIAKYNKEFNDSLYKPDKYTSYNATSLNLQNDINNYG